MACEGTYLGPCCGPPPEDYSLKAVARVRGWTGCRRGLNQDWPGDRQALFNGFVLQLDWSFTHGGVNYGGGFVRRNERAGRDHNDPFITSDRGTPFPTPFGAHFDFVYDEIDQIVATGRIRKRSETDINTWDDVGVMQATMLDSLPSAVGTAIADVNSYDPVTGLWGGAYLPSPTIGPTGDRIYRTMDRPRFQLDPELDIGTIAPVCGAYPPNAAGITSSQFFVPAAFSGHTAVATRAVFAPRSGRQLKLLKNYTPECGFPGPPAITECEAVDAEAGVDVAPSELLPGYQIVRIVVTEHPLGASPC